MLGGKPMEAVHDRSGRFRHLRVRSSSSIHVRSSLDPPPFSLPIRQIRDLGSLPVTDGQGTVVMTGIRNSRGLKLPDYGVLGLSNSSLDHHRTANGSHNFNKIGLIGSQLDRS